ncbi:DUF6318 family protein [Pseudarthrobacter sp. NPDC058329]|uniref:DUF6318 family protein n=1 Tax=Pseudarthrobacter sp. NPDC058329 TaxID=3346448 RepID=UPI0036DCF47E
MTSHNVFTSGSMRLGTAAAVVAGALMLASCAGGAPADPGTASPAATESVSSRPTATPTPTPSAVYKPADASGPAQNVPVPVLPEAAKTETKEGAEAFTRYWFEQLNYAYQTGDIRGVQAVTSPSCEYCGNITDSLTTNYQENRWLAGGRITVPAATTTFERSPDGNYQVVIQVLQDTISYHQANGSEFRAATQPSNTGNVLLVGFHDSAWRVNGLHPLR